MLTREGAALFRAIVCQVPLLDMQRYHLLLAGASWMAEYGNPDKPSDWEFLQNHSPYHRLQSTACLGDDGHWRSPCMLFTTSTRDDRVHPGHARKMVKALLDMPLERGGGPDNVFYWENIEGGHGGAADNKQRAYMWALSYNFLQQVLTGMTFAKAEADATEKAFCDKEKAETIEKLSTKIKEEVAKTAKLKEQVAEPAKELAAPAKTQAAGYP